MEKRVTFRGWLLPVLLLAPQVAVTLVFFFWPAGQAVFQAFHLADPFGQHFEYVGLENFTFYGNEMFRACAAIGAVGVMAGTVVTVLATALVNVISEMTGGIRLVVIEEEPEG